MEIIQFENAELLAHQVADEIIDLLKLKPNATLVLTSGNTPIRAYQILAEKADKSLFDDCMIIGLDEWVGIGPENEGSCQFIVKTHLLDPLSIDPQNYTFFDALSGDLQSECKRVDDLIENRGALDYIVVGLGMNGHIGLNEPGYSFDNYCHITDLAETTISVGQKYFKSETPLSKGITIGLQHLLEAEKAVLMVTGDAKAKAVQQLIDSEVGSDFPATVFRLHSNGKVYLDQGASGEL
jgi:galactosamine-6-phosphate isomerase